MTPRVLALLFLVGCATAPDPAPPPDDPADDGSTAVEQDGVCELNATVTVRVDNRSSMDVQITFGPYAPARAAEGLSRTTYRVARPYLRSPIRLAVARGGLGLGTPPPVYPEPVVCNVGTLVIWSRPRYAIFYGDALGGDSWEDEDPAPRE
jgi:hypothetical protein